MMLQPKDHVTVSGTVVKVENGCVLVRTKAGDEFWIEEKDLKTYRPMNEDKEND